MEFNFKFKITTFYYKINIINIFLTYIAIN